MQTNDGQSLQVSITVGCGEDLQQDDQCKEKGELTTTMVSANSLVTSKSVKKLSEERRKTFSKMYLRWTCADL